MSHAPEAPDRHVIWVRGPHLASANGVLLAGRRLLTSRQALFTYPDAESTRAEAAGADGASAVSAACCPAQCLLMNQAVEFSIVAVPAAFIRQAGVRPVQLAADARGALQPVLEGDEVAIVANTGGQAARGCTIVARLMVDEVTETELCLHALEPWACAEIGSPIFRHGKFVAMVVALPSQEGKEGLRALRVEAIIDRLKKRMQVEDAFDSAPDVRYNSDGTQAIRVPAAVTSSALTDDSCAVIEWTAVDIMRRTLVQVLTRGAVTTKLLQGRDVRTLRSARSSARSSSARSRALGAVLVASVALAGFVILKAMRK